MRMSFQRAHILWYLWKNSEEWHRPTDVGKIVGGGSRHSAWASPKMMGMFYNGLIARNGDGHYKIMPKGVQWLEENGYT
jgi:hypothetical protein